MAPRSDPLRSGYADVAAAAGFAAAAVIEAVLRAQSRTDLVVMLSGALVLVVLALRRSHPLGTVTVFCGSAVLGTLVQRWLTPDTSSDATVVIFGLLFAMFSVAAYGSWRDIALAAPQPIALLATVDLTQDQDQSVSSGLLFFTVFVVAVPLIGGRLVRGRTHLVQRLAEQGRSLAEQRGAFVGAARAAERRRVAEELHDDLVAGMQQLLGSIPEQYADAGDVSDLEQRARSLLATTREAVVALTDDTSNEPLPAVPAPSLPASVPAGQAAQPWTILTATALATGLLLELPSMSLRVAGAVGVAAIVALVLPLAFAWWQPLPAVGLMWLLAAGFVHVIAPLTGTISVVGLSFVLPFTVAALEPRRRAVLGLVISWAGAAAVLDRDDLVANAALAVTCWLAGAAYRHGAQLVEELHANNALLEQGRAALARQAIDEERTRIAREVHDALGHSLTVVALQANGARRVWDSDRAKAEAMLATINSAAASGLTELQRGFELMDGGREESISTLLAQARRAGLTLSAHIDEAVDGLPVHLRTALYRVVQESVTNVLKHCPGAATTVTVTVGSHDVEVAVTNSAASSLRPAADGQQHRTHGLTGMRRRVEECGGQFAHQPLAYGGWSVQARMPLLAMAPA